MAKLTIPEEEYMDAGHLGCQGCGATNAMRYVLKALGEKTIMSIPACCWAVIPGAYPNSCLNIPLVYNAFEATGASISGIRAALDAKGIKDVNVVGWAGDGGTADIGIQALSGMVERDTDAIYICYDNEAYMNTGIQRSSSTPMGAWTTTTPVGKTSYWELTDKKNMVEIMVAHKIPYAATASISYPEDLIKKVKKAASIKGPSYVHIFAPCPTGWKSDPSKSIEIGKRAVTTNIFPLYEVENGVYKINMKPKTTSIIEYMKLQGRFRHLDEAFAESYIDKIEQNWNELLRKEEFTNPK